MQVLAIPNFNLPPEYALWDTADPDVLMLADATTFYVFVYAPVSIAGPVVQLVSPSSLSLLLISC